MSSVGYKGYSIFPIQDIEAYEFYKKQEAAIWSSSELDFSRDMEDFNNLDQDKKEFIMHILSFFASGDGIVTENISTRFLLEATNFEEKAFYLAQAFIETVHAETYSMTIFSLIRDEQKRLELFMAGETNQAVRKKEKWMEKFTRGNQHKLERLAAFAASEGIFFSGAFSVIFWIGTYNILQNLIFSNVQISKDEALHCQFAVNRILRHPDFPTMKENVRKVIGEGSELEMQFMDEVMPEKPLDNIMNKKNMQEYIKYVTNYLLLQLGLEVLYPNAVNPFPFMTAIGLNEKSNFFEVRVGNYKRFSVKHAMSTAMGELDDDPFC